MVNNNTHPKYSLSPYSGSGSRLITKIKCLYDLSHIQTNCTSEDVNFVTEDCRNDVASLAWDTAQVFELIKSLNVTHYLNSEWCKINGNQYYPCDAYKITQSSYNKATNRLLPCFYYIKLAVSTGGNLVLIVSCHASN